MTPSTSEIQVQDFDRYGIITGILESICLAEKINKYVPFLVVGTYSLAFSGNFQTFIYSDR
jgi:hypothetical protein